MKRPGQARKGAYLLKLKTLVRDYPFSGRAESGVEVQGIRHDSRSVRPGDVYVCLEGLKTDGHLYATQAVAKGAVAVVARRPLDLGVPVFLADDTREAFSYLSDRFFAHPSHRLHVTGVTGTNGKTTTTHFLQAVYRAGGFNCAIIGTVGLKIGGQYTGAGLTTPEAFDLHRIFSEVAKQHISHVAMEVSSHSLAGKRVEHVSFDTAVFLNLSHDHLDFHKTMEEYFLTKAKLFRLNQRGQVKAVINSDDTYGRRLADLLESPVMTYGFGEEAHAG